MTNEIRSPNVEKLSVVQSPVSSFGFRNSFGFRHSSFGFENYSLFNQKAGQRTGESGRGWVGSWKAPSALRPCLGTLNRSESPSTALRAPSPPLGEKDGMRGFGSWKASMPFFASIGTVNGSRRGDAAADLLIALSAATSQWRLPGCFLLLLTLLAVGGR